MIIGKLISDVAIHNKRGSVGESENVRSKTPPAIRQVLTDIDYHGYITIEQERDPRNSGTSLRDVTESLNYLQGAGF